jgi:hypothetical protein
MDYPEMTVEFAKEVSFCLTLSLEGRPYIEFIKSFFAEK